MNPAPDALIFATRTGARLLNWDRETKAIQETSNTTDWTRHDLRRTGATMLGDMGEMPDIIEAALNHVAIHSVLAATYNRSRYRPQVAMALQRLADALDGIEAGAGQVIPLKARTVLARACHQLAGFRGWAPPAYGVGPVSPDCHTRPSIGVG